MSSPLGIPGLQQPDEIGRGGHGIVYRAEEPEFGRTVAVKIFQDRIDDDEVRRAFAHECQVLGRLSGHPNIVAVHRGGTTDLGEPYIVTDLLAGSLDDRLRRSGRLPWPEVLAIGVVLAGALETAHRAGILHLDVKPANVLLSGDDRPELVDFGLSRLPGVTTTDDRVRAGIAYAAPERLLDGAATPAADLYALGSTLYTLLVGEPAFTARPGEDLPVAISRIVRQPVPDLGRHGLPEPAARVVERLLAKSPVDRYATAADAAFALQVAQRSTGRTVTRVVVDGVTGARGAAPTRPARPAADPDGGDEHPPPDRPRYVPRSRPARPGTDPGPGRTLSAIPPASAAAGVAHAGRLQPAGHGVTATAPGTQAHAPATPSALSPPPPAPTPATPTLTPAPATPALIPAPAAGAPATTAAPPAPATTRPRSSALSAIAAPAVPAPRHASGPAAPPPRPVGAGPEVPLFDATWSPPAPTPGPAAAPARPPRPGRPRPRWLIAAIVAVLALLTVVLGGLLLGGSPAAGPSSGATSAAAAPPDGPAPAPPAIAVAASVTHPRRDAVSARLDGYFQAIDGRDYGAAYAAFAPDSAVVRNGLDAFRTTNSTTAISDQRIVAIADLPGDRVQATVTYRSTQDAEFGPDGQTCTTWQLAYELVGPDLLIRKARALADPAAC